MQDVRQPDYPLLFSLRGFLYCDLLLASPERAAWQLILNSSLATNHSSLADYCRSVSQRAAPSAPERSRGRNECEQTRVHATGSGGFTAGVIAAR